MKKFKKNWKKILSLGLVIVIGMAAIGGIAGFAARDTRTIPSTSFSRGGLDDKGIHVDTKQSIYTKEAIACSGLTIEQDFESHATYDVFYYDVNDSFLKADKGLYGKYTVDSDLFLAKYARIVIHPEIPADADAKTYSIGFFEVYEIANDLKITVDKEQKYLYDDSVNFYDDSKVYEVGDGLKSTTDIVLFDKNGDVIYDNYDIYIPITSSGASYKIVLTASDGSVWTPDVSHGFQTEKIIGDWLKVSFNVSDYIGAEDYISFKFQVPSSVSGCYVFGYN